VQLGLHRHRQQRRLLLFLLVCPVINILLELLGCRFEEIDCTLELPSCKSSGGG
jgi:hypothetical protein